MGVSEALLWTVGAVEETEGLCGWEMWEWKGSLLEVMVVVMLGCCSASAWGLGRRLVRRVVFGVGRAGWVGFMSILSSKMGEVISRRSMVEKRGGEGGVYKGRGG